MSPLNGATLSAAVFTLALVGLVAAALPAWRAATIDPSEAMRAD